MGTTMIQIGKFGEIKKTMKLLSKRDSHIDMEFICGENQEILNAHRFIIGAQSRYLKSIMESTPTENEKISIYLPGAEKSQMEVVLKFLYTGRLSLTKAMITPVRELLEEVLRIDADFKMPSVEDILALQENSSKDNNDGNGGSGGDIGHDTSQNSTNSSGDSSRHASSREPPKKRCRPSSDTNGSHASHRNTRPLRPMTPPHELEADDDDEIQIIDPSSKILHEPTIIGLSENETSSQNPDTEEEEKCQQSEINDNNIHRIKEESDFNKVTVPTTVTENRVPTARKRTGKRYHTGTSQGMSEKFRSEVTWIPPVGLIDPLEEHNQYRTDQITNQEMSDVISMQQTRQAIYHALDLGVEYDTPSNNHLLDVALTGNTDELMTDSVAQLSSDNYQFGEGDPVPSTSRTTRSSSGAIQTPNFTELSDDEFDNDDKSDPNYHAENGDDGTWNHDNWNHPTASHLPPPLPEAPEPGLILYRGKWIKRQKLERIKANAAKSQTNQVRRYNWTDGASITGRKLEETEMYRAEPEGRHECVICGVVFTHSRSLQVHWLRSHNSKANVPCPENCGKFFTSTAAIKKHLLSHRPETEWPFVCLFCGKHFQARADLPKHYQTKQHINDPRIPALGTPAWTELMKRSEIVPSHLLNNAPKRQRQRPTTISVNPLPSMSSEVPPTFVDMSENNEEEEESQSPPVSPPMMDNVVDEDILDTNEASASALINDSNLDTIKKQEDTEEDDDDEIPDFDDDVPSPISIS